MFLQKSFVIDDCWDLFSGWWENYFIHRTIITIRRGTFVSSNYTRCHKDERGHKHWILFPIDCDLFKHKVHVTTAHTHSSSTLYYTRLYNFYTTRTCNSRNIGWFCNPFGLADSLYYTLSRLAIILAGYMMINPKGARTTMTMFLG